MCAMHSTILHSNGMYIYSAPTLSLLSPGNTVDSSMAVTSGCVPPYISNFGVSSWEQSSNETDILSVLKWNPVNHNVNACVVTGWSIRYASWPSYLGLPEADFRAPPHAVWSQPLDLPAIANSASIAALNSTNYHIFQLSTSLETQPINKLVINSHIFYFQAQGGLLHRSLAVLLIRI